VVDVRGNGGGWTEYFIIDKRELSTRFPDEWRAWETGDPHRLKVTDSSCGVGGGSTTTRYPLLELWDRADRVWDEIWKLEARLDSSPSARSGNSHGNRDEDDATDTDGVVPTGTQIRSLIVAHGSLGQALLGTAMGWDATRFREHEFPNCGLVEIEWDDAVVIRGDSDAEAGAASPISYSSSTMARAATAATRKRATRWRWRWRCPRPPATADADDGGPWNYYCDARSSGGGGGGGDVGRL